MAISHTITLSCLATKSNDSTLFGASNPILPSPQPRSATIISLDFCFKYNNNKSAGLTGHDSTAERNPS